MQHQSYYATIDPEGENLVIEPRLDRKNARQRWIFHGQGTIRMRTAWTIKSVANGKYLCATSEDDIKARKSSPTLWCTQKVDGDDSRFRIYRYDESGRDNDKLISVSLGSVKSGDKIQVFKECLDKGEIWVMQRKANRFINLATQSPNKLQVGHSIESCTGAVEHADPFDLDGRRIILFDTPAFDSTNKTETEILRIIAFELEKRYRKGQILHGIIYVHRISDAHVNDLAKTNFGIFRELCGDYYLRNVIIMSNMWSRLSSEVEGHRRITELAGLDDFFKPAIAKGAAMMHHMQDTVESAHMVIRQILKNHPIALRIQEEIVDQGKSINETGAGMAVDEELAQLTHQYELKLKMQFAAARRERDEGTRKEQLKEVERARQLLEKVEEEKRNQVREYHLLHEQFAKDGRTPQQAIGMVEERIWREIQAAQTRGRWDAEAVERRRHWQEAEASKLRQEAEAAELRLAKQKEDLKAKTRIIPSPSLKHGNIVSGRTYVMYNMQHQSYYATIDAKGENFIIEPQLGKKNGRQRWTLHCQGTVGMRTAWTIKSVTNGRYLCATSEDYIKARKTSTPTLWCTQKVDGNDSRFRIYRYDKSGQDNDKLISVPLGSVKSGATIQVLKQSLNMDEIWVMQRHG
ncbi:hypothetical protein H1R20_g15027, partial [Candolleomyces eurysporus]